jgi:hypothetical protein
MDDPVVMALRHPYQFIQEIGLWRGIAWGVAGVAVWDGAGFFVRGNSIAQGPSLEVLRNVPFGLHLHGFIMLVLASAIIYSSHDRPLMARRVFLVVFAYSVWISAAVISGWIITRQIVWSAPSKWFFIAWVSIILAATPDKMKNRVVIPPWR